MPGTKDPNNPSRFKKGQSGNPKGSSKRYRDLAGLYRMSHKDVVLLGTEILEGGLGQLAAIRDDKTASVHKIWLASLIVDAIQNKNYRSYHALMDRLIGRPKQQVEHSGEDGGPIRTQTVPATLAAITSELRQMRRADDELGDD